jgi:hypothetical protein
MACVDVYRVDVTGGTRQMLKHFAVPVGATLRNQTVTLPVDRDSSVEILDIEFATALSDANLESGTNDPIIMVLGYTDRQGVPRELVVPNLRDYVISEGNAFSTGSVTHVRMLIRDIVSVQSLQLMPYNIDPQITAGWKPSQITVSLGAEGSVQKATRTLDTYIYEDEDAKMDFDGEITGEMVGGLKVSLSNIILSVDVSASNESGNYGNSYRVNSAGNKTLNLTVSSGAGVKFNVSVLNSKQGYAAKAEQTEGVKDISGLIFYAGNEFRLSMPENTSGQDQTYRITVYARENENVAVEITVTVKSQNILNPPTDPTEPPTDPTEPTTEPTEPPTDPTEPTTEPTEPPTEPTEPSTEPTEPSTEPTESPTDPTESFE